MDLYIGKAVPRCFAEVSTNAGLKKVRNSIERAIELDPDFALAHGALSLTLAIGHILGFVPRGG